MARAVGLAGGKPGAAGTARGVVEKPGVDERADRLIAGLRASGPLSVAKLAVASSQLRAVSRK